MNRQEEVLRLILDECKKVDNAKTSQEMWLSAGVFYSKEINYYESLCYIKGVVEEELKHLKEAANE